MMPSVLSRKTLLQFPIARLLFQRLCLLQRNVSGQPSTTGGVARLVPGEARGALTKYLTPARDP